MKISGRLEIKDVGHVTFNDLKTLELAFEMLSYCKAQLQLEHDLKGDRS